MSENDYNPSGKYVIELKHQTTPENRYTIKDFGLTKQVTDLCDRLTNYKGQITEDDNDLPVEVGSYWITGLPSGKHKVGDSPLAPLYPAFLLVGKIGESSDKFQYTLIDSTGQIWVYNASATEDQANTNQYIYWDLMQDNYYTKQEIDEMLGNIEDDYNRKINALQALIDSITNELSSMKSQLNAIGAITGGSNPLTGNILILGDNSLFNTVISGEVNMAQRLADKLNLPASSGVVWLQNNNTDDLYSYLQYSNASFNGIYLPATNQNLTYSASIALQMTMNNDAVILPFNKFSVVVYIANMGDIVTLNSATDLNKSVNTVTTNITWEDGTAITYNGTPITPKIPTTVSFSSSTPTAHAQAVVEFITPLIADGGVVYITTPITWNLNGQTALTSLQTSCRDALLMGLQAVANKNSLTYKSIYCIGELQRSNCLAADSKTVTSETAIDNYISNLCTMINEIKNNNVTFTPVNHSDKGTLVLNGKFDSDGDSFVSSRVQAGGETNITMTTAGNGTISYYMSENIIRGTSYIDPGAEDSNAGTLQVAMSYYKKSEDTISEGVTTHNTHTLLSSLPAANAPIQTQQISWAANDVITISHFVKRTGFSAGTAQNNTTKAQRANKKIVINYPWQVSITSP